MAEELQPKTERQIIWKTVTEEGLRQALANTILDDLLQTMFPIHQGSQLIGMPHLTKEQRQSIQNIRPAAVELYSKLQATARLLKADLTQPVPIDLKYGEEHPMIALDQLPNLPK